MATKLAVAQGRAAAQQNESDAPVVPITVRQLEAVVRIAESFARMQLQPVATEAHVRRALDLFTVSTMDAVKSGVMEAVVRVPYPSNLLLPTVPCSGAIGEQSALFGCRKGLIEQLCSTCHVVQESQDCKCIDWTTMSAEV